MGIVENKEVNAALAETIKPELLPTKERIMDRISYTAAFLGGCVSVGTFSMGASLIGVLNMTQAIVGYDHRMSCYRSGLGADRKLRT